MAFGILGMDRSRRGLPVSAEFGSVPIGTRRGMTGRVEDGRVAPSNLGWERGVSQSSTVARRELRQDVRLLINDCYDPHRRLRLQLQRMAGPFLSAENRRRQDVGLLRRQAGSEPYSNRRQP